ncbi:hypothetical protein [Chitinophaga qingshengii]|uniref:Anti-sigma factor n=1 Tax=Chitinophaga qingshengii TaxID=1569794 RepID=A0ABR7TWU1_9BACT|nr:hypothetical protein [Chitinophaga qingshengii]MBC9934135.1 hypothetical protein [Chitinophaga qingshengii]
MDIERYISSGIIESYLLGLTSDEESAELERMCVEYPELEIEILRCEQRMDSIMYDEAVLPPERIKERVLQNIRRETEENTISNYPIIHIQPDNGEYVFVRRVLVYVLVFILVVLNLVFFLNLFYYYKFEHREALPKVHRASVTTKVVTAKKAHPPVKRGGQLQAGVLQPEGRPPGFVGLKFRGNPPLYY